MGLQRLGPRTDLPRQARPPDRGAPDQQPAVDPPAARLHAVDLGAPARLGVAAGVRRLRERHHEPGVLEGLPLPELAAGAHALVPRPRVPPHHRRERLHGTRRDVPDARQPRALAAHPDRCVRRPPHRRRPDVQRGRVAAVRQQRPEGPLRRRDHRQRGAVARDEGRPTQVPLPHPQRLGLPFLRVVPRQRRHHVCHRDRRRTRADTAEGEVLPPRQRRALRGRHRLRRVRPRHPLRAAQPVAEERRGLHPHRQGDGVRGGGRRLDSASNALPGRCTPRSRRWR